ncbi:K02A2.6-like, partial [Cordylochernes scorpioides]
MHKATMAQTHHKNAQNVSIQQDNSHIKCTRDHTSSHHSHTRKHSNKRDTRTKRRQKHHKDTCTINDGTTTPLTRNIETIHAIQPPHNRKTLPSFLSAVNAYKQLIPAYARLRTPLNNLLKKDVTWVWDDKCQKAFISLKESLTTHPTLHLYQEGLPCQVYCDASTLGIRGVLKQVHPDGKIYPVQYFSRAPRSHERNYSISELECLAIVESMDKFRVYLMGRKFTIFFYHHALQWLKTIKNPSGRLFRWRLRLSRYENEVRYIKGAQQYETNINSCNPFCGFLDAPLIKSHQPSPSGNPKLTIDHNGLHTISRKGVTKIIIPKTLTNKLFQSVHTQYNHPGISKMTKLISAQYYWQDMSQDIAKKAKTCPTCQLTKRIDRPNQHLQREIDTVHINKLNPCARYSPVENHHSTKTAPSITNPIKSTQPHNSPGLTRIQQDFVTESQQQSDKGCVLRTCMFSHVTRRSVTVPARIQPPETFDFSTPNEWPKWRKRFERYLVVSGMKKKEEADKIDLFLYLMGDRADDIFRTFKFEKEEEATKIDSVLKAFDSHFCVRKNIIYGRAKFNSRIQEDREPVDEFITSLYKLADSCEFEGLHEQLIRDRIVVGVRDKALSERMQLDSELTLEKAVKMVRQQEAVRQQQVDLQRPSTSQKVNQTVGMFISTLRNGNYEIKEKIYVIRRLSEPLLSRRACELLNLARRIKVVATRINPIKEIPEVFEGLGQIGNPYEIKLKPGAKPYAVHTPRRVPIPLMEKLKTRLEELEKAGIIAQVNVATEWCAPTVIAGIDGVMCYLEDILIFASDSKTPILRLVLRKLKEANVTLNKAKCVFGMPRINFLGYILDEDGIRPDPAKIEAVAKMPALTDVHGVRFLGMVNHLGRFVENSSEIVAPLNQLLVKGQDFVWDCRHERAFRKLKELLTTQPILAAYDFRKPTMVSSDASSYGLGAVLKQKGKNGIWRPVAYSSRTMTPTEKRYAQIEKNALAITWTCEVGTSRRNRFHLRKGDTVQYPADPSTPTFSGEELVENEKTPVVDYPSIDSEDGQIRTRSGRIVKPVDRPHCYLYFAFKSYMNPAKKKKKAYKPIVNVADLEREDEMVISRNCSILSSIGHPALKSLHEDLIRYIASRTEIIKALATNVENLTDTLESFAELDEIEEANKPKTACRGTQTCPAPSCKETSSQTDPIKPATPAPAALLAKKPASTLPAPAPTKRKQSEAPNPPAKRTNLNCPSKPAPSRVSKPAAAQVILHGEKSAAHTVVISDDPQADPREMLKAVRAAHTLPQGVWASLHTKGKLVLHSSNPDTIPEVTTSLASKLNGMKVRQQKEILPRICLFKVDEETSNSTIEETFLETAAVRKLPGDKVVRVAHRSAPRSGTCTAFIEMDLKTFRALGVRGRIVVDGVILNFEESIRARVCFRCCGFGHNSAQCSRAPKCFHCGQDGHEGRACPSIADQRTSKFNYEFTKNLADESKWRAVGRMEAGQSQVEVAKWLNVNKSVVSKIWKQFIETGTIKIKEGSGRKRKTATSEDRYLVVTAKRHREMTAIQLSNELSSATGTRISRQTVYRRLHEGALYARRPMVCIPLTSAHRRARLNWCLEHHAWTHDQWANVLFSDESRFSLNTDSRRVFIWRELGTRYHPSNIKIRCPVRSTPTISKTAASRTLSSGNDVDSTVAGVANEPVTAMANQVCTNNISLMTLIVKIKGSKRPKMVRVLLDSGSQKSYIRRSLAKELELAKVGEVKLKKTLFGGQTTGEKAHTIFYFQLDNVDEGKAFKMEALEETIICGDISPVETGPRQWKLDKKGITLTKLDNNKTEIDILIGRYYYGQLLTGKIEQLAGGLTAIQTVLGWTLIGNTSSETLETSAQMDITLLTTQQRIASLWELETIGIRDPTEVISEKNVIYERALFNSRMYEEGETIDEFITSLYSLAESCEYATLHDEMIRDRIVVGVRDKKNSERLQLDESLTLEKALKTVRQFEAVRKQQDDLRNPYNSKVNRVKTAKKTFQKIRQQNTQTTNGVQIEKCINCGKFHFQGKTCPALQTICNKWNALGHWESCCKANLPSTSTQNDGRQKWKKKQTMVKEVTSDESTSRPNAFLLTLAVLKGSEPWIERLKFDNVAKRMKLDIEEGVTAMPPPSDVKDVRRFMGMVNHLGKYLENLVDVAAPLNELLRKAVLKQLDNKGNWKPVAYAFRTMSPTEKHYAQIEKEALALTWACERFQEFLIGRTFQIETDHKPLVPIFSTKELDVLTPIIQRFRIRMMRLSYTIQHIPGKDLIAADALSRQPLISTQDAENEKETDAHMNAILSSLPITDKRLAEIFEGQQHDIVINQIKKYLEQGWPEKKKTAKRRIKILDPSLDFLEYRATPLENGYSPAELLMGRQLRTTVPASSEILLPKLVDSEKIQSKERERRVKMKNYYDKSHSAKDLDELEIGDLVWIADLRTWGKIMKKAPTPRLYFIKTPRGVFGRNRFHLRKGYPRTYPLTADEIPDKEPVPKEEPVPMEEPVPEELQ